MNNEAGNLTSNEPIKFARDILWVGLYLAIAAVLSIITLVALTKSYSPEMYGVWAQITVVLSLITPLLTLQLSIASVRFLSGEADKEKRRRYMGSMTSIILLFSLFMFVTANFFVTPISNFLFADSTYTLYVRLTSFWALIDSLFLFFISYLRARGLIKRLSFIQVSFLLTKMVLILVLPGRGMDLVTIIGCLIAAEVLFTLGILYLIVKDIGLPVPNLDGLSGFLAFSAPQIPSAVLMWVIQGSDRYFITHFLNLSMNGIYSSSVLLTSIIYLCYAPINYALLPIISVAWEQNRRADVRVYLEYSTKLFLTIAIPTAIGISLLSQPLLKILTTAEFLAGGELVLLISIGIIFAGIYEINLFIIYLVKRTKWLPLLVLVVLLTSGGLNFLLVPRIGIMGAAISDISTYLILAVLIIVWAQRIFRYSVDLRYLAKIFGATLVMAGCLILIPVNGVLGVILALIAGSAIYIGMMMILRAFSQQDKRLVKNTFGGFIPWLH